MTATTCENCGKGTNEPQSVDLPLGMILCENCFEDHVWECDSCSKKIAASEVEGGEDPGIAPLRYDSWCQKCCNEKVAQCDECQNSDLVEDMTQRDGQLLCEYCAGENGSASDGDNSQVLTKENWKDAVAMAIAELPENIQSSVGEYVKSDDCVVIRVCCEPLPNEDGETQLNNIEVRWWNTQREQRQSSISNQPEGGFEGIIEPFTAMGVIDIPTITVTSDGASASVSVPYPGRGTVEGMKQSIQEAILNELYEGGGMSMVSQDRKGRFTYDDGTIILEWQRPPKRA